MLMSQRNDHAHRSMSLSRPRRQPPPQSRAPSPSSASTMGRFTSGSLRRPAFHSSFRTTPAPPDKLVPDTTDQSIYAPPSISGSIRHYQPPQVARTSNQPSKLSPPSSSSANARQASYSSGRESVLGGFLERIGTLRRRGKSKKVRDEGEEIYAEGLKAIDGNTVKPSPLDLSQHDSLLEGQTRVIIESSSIEQENFKQLRSLLINWINDELTGQRIIIKELDDDLYDGQILGKLIEKLHGVRLDVVEVTQNERSQKHKLRTVLSTINEILLAGPTRSQPRWSVDGIHSKNLVEIIQLLMAMAHFYRAPIKLPENVRVRVMVVQKFAGKLQTQHHEVQLTGGDQVDKGPQVKQHDAFDTLMQSKPETLDFVQDSLVKFVNRHLSKVNLSCVPAGRYREMDARQFSDGVKLIFLMASLEDYFVPLGNIFLRPTDETPGTEPIASGHRQARTAIEPNNYVNTLPIQKLHNVNIAFQLMEDAGIEIKEQVRVEDIVIGDLKSVLRVLYTIFSRYKHL